MNLKNRISICIPVHLRHDSDLYFLKEAMESIRIQDFKNHETILSVDQATNSQIDEIEKFISETQFANAKIYLSFGRGISRNLNNAVKRANYEIVKILFQDDFLTDSKSLSRTAKKLVLSNQKWLVSSSAHLFVDEPSRKWILKPNFSVSIMNGKNTVSGPSVVTIFKSAFLPFDENLELMMDCEWYVRNIHHYGFPAILRKPSVTNRVHANQHQNVVGKDLRAETELLRSRHDKTELSKGNCSCIIN